MAIVESNHANTAKHIPDHLQNTTDEMRQLVEDLSPYTNHHPQDNFGQGTQPQDSFRDNTIYGTLAADPQLMKKFFGQEAMDYNFDLFNRNNTYDEKTGSNVTFINSFQRAYRFMTGRSRNVEFANKSDPDDKIKYHAEGINNMRIRPKLTASKPSPDSIKNMLDLAEDQGWDSIKLKGFNRNFKKEAWLQAQMRGLHVTGYKPTPYEVAKLNKMLAYQQDLLNMHKQNPELVPQSQLEQPPYLSLRGAEAVAMKEAQQYNSREHYEQLKQSIADKGDAILRGQQAGAQQGQEANAKDAEKDSPNSKINRDLLAQQRRREEEQEEAKKQQGQEQQTEQTTDKKSTLSTLVDISVAFGFIRALHEHNDKSQSPQHLLMQEVDNLPDKWKQQMVTDLAEIRSAIEQTNGRDSLEMPSLREKLNHTYMDMALKHCAEVTQAYDKQKGKPTAEFQPHVMNANDKQIITEGFTELKQSLVNTQAQIAHGVSQEKITRTQERMQERTQEIVQTKTPDRGGR